mgnify:FL=1
MKKLLALYLALLSTYSFAYVGDIPISQSKNIGIKQTEAPNLMSKMDTKVRIYNDSSLPIKTSAYYVDSSWDYANSWQPSKGFGLDMKDRHAEVVPAHSWIDIYSGDNSNLATPSIKYNVYGGYINNAVSFTFGNISSDGQAGGFSIDAQPMDFYHGYDDNYIKKIFFDIKSKVNMYSTSLCTALVITDTSATVVPNLNRDTCDVMNADKMFSIY